MNYCKEPKRLPDGRINLKLNHPRYGWIDFTASPHDPEEHGRLIYEKADQGSFGPVQPCEQEPNP